MLKKITLALLIVALLMPQLGFTNQPFDTRVPELTALKTDASAANELRGSAKGAETVIAASFTDTNRVFGSEAIARMGALGIVKEYGVRRYRPAAAATGYEALGQLTRLMGAEAAITERVLALTGTSTTDAQRTRIRNQEILREAETRGIVRPDEVLGLNNPVSKERLTVWTARALGIQPQMNQVTTFSFNDWQNVNPGYRALIENMITEGIVGLTNNGSFQPKNNVTRAELATIMSSAARRRYAALNLESNFGLIIGDLTETLKEPDNTITRRTLTVKNADGSVSKLISERHTKNRARFDYAVHKGGITSDNKLLAMGDEIEYLTQGGELVYAQVLDHNLVLEKINASVEADIYTRFQFGTVADIRSKSEMKNGKSVMTEIYRIVDVSGDVFDILVSEDTFTGQRDDIITYKDGKVGGVKLLKAGDVIQYLVTEKRQVVYIKVGDLNEQFIAGTVREVSKITATGPATVTIFGYDDRVYTLPLAPYANTTINDRLANIEDYVYGMPVEATVVNSQVLTLKGESYTGEPGFIPAFGKMRIGDVDAVFRNGFRITLPGGRKESYNITPQTVFMKDGISVSWQAMKVGLPVKVYFDDIVSDNVSRVEIESPEILFEIIYKGMLRTISAPRGDIQITGVDGLSKPEFIVNNAWSQADAFNIPLKVDGNTKIYAGNERLSLADLNRSYMGYPIYAVVKSVFGQPTVVKMSIMTGGEMIHSSNIRRVDHTLGSFELNTRENFNLTEVTIVIRDGLVLPNANINIRDTVFVFSESTIGTYEKNAMVVKVITPFDNIFNGIRIGAIESVNPSNFTIRNHTQYFNNFINAVNPNESGFYKFYTNSQIKDITDRANIKTIKPADFWHASYARIENRDKDYQVSQRGLQWKRYYAFMVVNEADNSVIAMNMRHKGLLPGQNLDDTLFKEEDLTAELQKTYRNAVLTRGIVVGKDETWDRIELTDSHDWTEYTGQWTANRTNIYARYTDAIIIKNNQVKTIDDIKPGDYLYIMRIKDQGLVIFIES